MVHGGGATALSLEPLLSRLQHRYRLLAPDRPGCGGTDFVNYRTVDLREHSIAFLNGILEHYGIDQVSLIGNSIGGYLGLVYALAHPERVRKLVLVGAVVGLDRHLPIVVRLLGVPRLNRVLAATVARPSVSLMRHMFKLLVADTRQVTEEQLELEYAQAVIPGAGESWLSLLEEFTTILGLKSRHYLFPELKCLETPTLFIWGDRDKFSPPAVGERARAVMPKAQIVVPVGAGHLCWIDRTEECVVAITEFLG
jgi:2-hydroxy-6-oxonona-2,4-dienedioate hydrolase